MQRRPSGSKQWSSRDEEKEEERPLPMPGPDPIGRRQAVTNLDCRRSQYERQCAPLIARGLEAEAGNPSSHCEREERQVHGDQKATRLENAPQHVHGVTSTRSCPSSSSSTWITHPVSCRSSSSARTTAARIALFEPDPAASTGTFCATTSRHGLPAARKSDVAASSSARSEDVR